MSFFSGLQAQHDFPIQRKAVEKLQLPQGFGPKSMNAFRIMVNSFENYASSSSWAAAGVSIPSEKTFELLALYVAYCAEPTLTSPEDADCLKHGSLRACAVIVHELAELAWYESKDRDAFDAANERRRRWPHVPREDLCGHLEGLIAEHLFLQRQTPIGGHEHPWLDLCIANPLYDENDRDALRYGLRSGSTPNRRILGSAVWLRAVRSPLPPPPPSSTSPPFHLLHRAIRADFYDKC